MSADVHVAYRVFGEGPFDVVFASGLEFPSVERKPKTDARRPTRTVPGGDICASVFCS